jgi:hypothetical protein
VPQIQERVPVIRTLQRQRDEQTKDLTLLVGNLECTAVGGRTHENIGAHEMVLGQQFFV